jgi:hypothetical protein
MSLNKYYFDNSGARSQPLQISASSDDEAIRIAERSVKPHFDNILYIEEGLNSFRTVKEWPKQDQAGSDLGLSLHQCPVAIIQTILVDGTSLALISDKQAEIWIRSSDIPLKRMSLFQTQGCRMVALILDDSDRGPGIREVLCRG